MIATNLGEEFVNVTALDVGTAAQREEQPKKTISLGALGDGERRGLSQCASRCVPNEQCVVGTFTYDPSYDWYCGRCRTENCTSNCFGCV